MSGLVGAPGCGVWHKDGLGTEASQVGTSGSRARDIDAGLVGAFDVTSGRRVPEFKIKYLKQSRGGLEGNRRGTERVIGRRSQGWWWFGKRASSEREVNWGQWWTNANRINDTEVKEVA